MSDGRTPQQVSEEAERILNSDVLKSALERIYEAALEELLAAKGDDADLVRREKADLINVVRAIPQALRVEMLVAQKEMKQRGGVA